MNNSFRIRWCKLGLALTLTCVSLEWHQAIAAGSASKQSPKQSPEQVSEQVKDLIIGCEAGLLTKLKKHVVTKSETLGAIATKYQLLPSTIMAFNPSTREGKVRPGETLQIPPLDGLPHRLQNEDTYRTIANKFGLRADVLFERNGCIQNPQVVFVPGAVWRQQVKLPDLVGAARQFESSYGNATQIIPPIFFAAGGYPLPFRVEVTSNYGWRINPVTGEYAFHSGIDLGAPLGTPTLATAAGVVQFAGWAGGYGNLIELSHGGFGSRYAHLHTIQVIAGQRVKQGQQIGLVGSTGRSTGPHLHFELLAPGGDGWITFDPASYLSRMVASEFERLFAQTPREIRFF